MCLSAICCYEYHNLTWSGAGLQSPPPISKVMVYIYFNIMHAKISYKSLNYTASMALFCAGENKLQNSNSW
jgi:hypothetical protein